MTGHTSDEQLGIPQAERSTDADSATFEVNPDRGVVQDGPGNPEAGTTAADDLSGNGNFSHTETGRADDDEL